MGHDKPVDASLIRPPFVFQPILGLTAGSEAKRMFQEFQMWVNWCRCNACRFDGVHCGKREDGCYQ